MPDHVERLRDLERGMRRATDAVAKGDAASLAWALRVIEAAEEFRRKAAPLTEAQIREALDGHVALTCGQWVWRWLGNRQERSRRRHPQSAAQEPRRGRG